MLPHGNMKWPRQGESAPPTPNLPLNNSLQMFCITFGPRANGARLLRTLSSDHGVGRMTSYLGPATTANS